MMTPLNEAIMLAGIIFDQLGNSLIAEEFMLMQAVWQALRDMAPQ
jgi:hypothetical protein